MRVRRHVYFSTGVRLWVGLYKGKASVMALRMMGWALLYAFVVVLAPSDVEGRIPSAGHTARSLDYRHPGPALTWSPSASDAVGPVRCA